MLRSLFAGVSGLRNHQVRMDVIGNNIANVNTVAFKSGRVMFKEGFAQLLQGASRPPGDQGGINPVQIGLGSQIGSIDQLFTQGNMETTGQATDLAIQGDSMFVVRKGNQSFYTRSGNFQLDAEGQLVSPTNGFVVQGEMYENGTVQDGVRDIRLPFGQKVIAKATSQLRVAGNLNASAPAVADPATFDVNSPADRAANPGAWTESSLTVYDSQGSKRDVKLQYWKVGANQWQWQLDPTSPTIEATVTVGAGGAVVLPDATADTGVAEIVTASGSKIDTSLLTPNPAPPNYLLAAGAGVPDGAPITVRYSVLPPADPANGLNAGLLAFDAQGNIDPTASTPMNVEFDIPGADTVRITVDRGFGAAGLTQFATTSTAVLRDQNGFTAGQLQNFSIDRYGLITGFFTNGTTSPLGRIVLADFNNPAGLLRSGDNMYQESANSGSAVLGYALEGSQSQITSGALEMSNVDLAQEFTNMIVAQRGFQANGKVISTSDEMLQELMQIKR